MRRNKNVTLEQKAQGWGDVWTWTAINADTKLCVGYLAGGRDATWAMDFMEDCAHRMYGRVQVTTDAHRAYLEAVEDAFGMNVDYAMLQKIYDASTDAEQRRYGPAQCIGADMKVISGSNVPWEPGTPSCSVDSPTRPILAVRFRAMLISNKPRTAFGD